MFEVGENYSDIISALSIADNVFPNNEISRNILSFLKEKIKEFDYCPIGYICEPFSIHTISCFGLYCRNSPPKVEGKEFISINANGNLYGYEFLHKHVPPKITTLLFPQVIVEKFYRDPFYKSVGKTKREAREFVDSVINILMKGLKEQVIFEFNVLMKKNYGITFDEIKEQILKVKSILRKGLFYSGKYLFIGELPYFSPAYLDYGEKTFAEFDILAFTKGKREIEELIAKEETK